MAMKVFFDSIGCRLNQSEIEKMAAEFRAAGHKIVPSPAQADLVIVNTCVVTTAAAADSRKKIRRAARSGSAEIVATGCYTTIDPQRISELPSVNYLVPNSEKDILVNRFIDRKSIIESGVQPRIPLPGDRKRTRAFIKVQDGCDNFCSYCITRIARGQSRSESIDKIFIDIESALAGGVKEIVLTGVNLGSWGFDLLDPKSLSYLVERIIREFSPLRVRLSSLEPWDVDQKIIEMLDLPGFCRHLHLPLQSGSDRVLKRMRRKTKVDEYRRVITDIRSSVPDIAITTDIMVGFPGETEGDFERSMENIKDFQFSGGHVFNFSSRPGTLAEKMDFHVPSRVKQERSKRMRELFEVSKLNYQLRFIGKRLDILWEKSKKVDGIWKLEGLSENYIRVESVYEKDLRNKCSMVIVNSKMNRGLGGEIVG